MSIQRLTIPIKNNSLISRILDVKSLENILISYLNPALLKHLITIVIELKRFEHFKFIIDNQLKCCWIYTRDATQLDKLDLDKRFEIIKYCYQDSMTKDIFEDIKKVHFLMYNTHLVHNQYVLKKVRISAMREKILQNKVYEHLKPVFSSMIKTIRYLIHTITQFKKVFKIYYPKHQNTIQHMINVNKCVMKISYLNQCFVKIILVSFKFVHVYLLKTFCFYKQRAFSQYLPNIFTLKTFSDSKIYTPIFYLIFHGKIFTFSNKKQTPKISYTLHGIDFKFNVSDKLLELLTGYTLLTKFDVYDVLCVHCIQYLFSYCKKLINCPLFWMNQHSKLFVEYHSKYIKTIVAI